MVHPRRLFSLHRQFRAHGRVPIRLLSTVPAAPEYGVPDIHEAPAQNFQKSQKRALKDRYQLKPTFSASSEWEVTCGLEVHAQLNTVRKLFSGIHRASCEALARPR